MRKILYLTALAILSAGLSAGVVGQDCPEGMMCIASGDDGGQTKAPASVNKSGDDWEAELVVENMTPADNFSEKVTNASFDPVNGTSVVTFDGVMKLNSSCYRPDFSVQEVADSEYELEISSYKKENTTCTQVITRLDYSFRFSSDSRFRLDVSQNNLTETYDYTDSGQEDESKENPSDQGLLAGFMNWLSGLF